MGDNVTLTVLVLVYGPALVMVALWLAAVLLAAVGRPSLRDWLLRRTAVPQEEHPPQSR